VSHSCEITEIESTSGIIKAVRRKNCIFVSKPQTKTSTAVAKRALKITASRLSPNEAELARKNASSVKSLIKFDMPVKVAFVSPSVFCKDISPLYNIGYNTKPENNTRAGKLSIKMYNLFSSIFFILLL